MVNWYLNINEEVKTSSVAMLRVLFLLTLTTFVVTKHLSAYIKTCRRDDPDFDGCVKKHATEAIPYIIKGDKDFQTPSLDPFLIPEIILDTGSLLTVKLNNVTLRGIADIQLDDIKIDLEKQNVYLKFFLRNVTIDGKYNVDGRILVIPIKGSGPVHLKCRNLVVDYTFDFKLIEKDGKKYVGPDISPKVTYTLEEIDLRLDNLFNGDKTLGDRTNEFLNEHALELNNDFSNTFAEAINGVATVIVKRILPSVPYDEVFP